MLRCREVTAACGGSDEEWQHTGAAECHHCEQSVAILSARMSRFHPAQAGFHSARTGRISLLILNSEIALTGSEIHGWSHERNYPLRG